MPYSTRDERRRSRSSSQRSRSSRNGRTTRTSRSNPPQSGSRRGTLTRPDTGYSLHSRRVRRESGVSGLVSSLMRPRVLLFVLILVLVIVVMVVGVTSCIRRNHDADNQKVEEAKPKNEQDARVAAGISASMTSRFTEGLDEAEALATIAENANMYDDDRMLSLALAEPSSREFVAAYPTSDKSTRPYDGKVTRGEVPNLYNWDEHWGAVTYGDGPLAVTGSGPTTLAMAYMGLTGKTDFTPTEIAQQANKSNYADGDTGSKDELFSKLGVSMGLTANEYDATSDTLLVSLGDTTVIAAEIKEDTLTDSPHWVLVVNVNSDGSVTVFDPTSTMVSSRPWDAATIAESSTKFYALSPSESTVAELEKSESSDKDSDENADEDSNSDDKGSGTKNSSSKDSSSTSSSSKKDSSSSSSDDSDDEEEDETYDEGY